MSWFGVIGELANWTVSFWLLAGFYRAYRPLARGRFADFAAMVKAELRPFIPVAATLDLLHDLVSDRPLISKVIAVAVAALTLFLYVKSKDDDDRWKRRRKKLTEKIQARGGRLVVAPSGA